VEVRIGTVEVETETEPRGEDDERRESPAGQPVDRPGPRGFEEYRDLRRYRV
jgi:hypothetical protein